MSEKTHYKIWEWAIERKDVPTSMNATGSVKCWYALRGISNHREGGRLMMSSRILRVDFDVGIVETLRSVYELQSGTFKEYCNG